MSPWRGLVLFSDMKRCKDWSWNQFLKISNHLKTFPPGSLDHGVPHSPPWTVFRACRRSAAAAAQDSISAEADGKYQFVADTSITSRLPIILGLLKKYLLESDFQRELQYLLRLQMRSEVGQWADDKAESSAIRSQIWLDCLTGYWVNLLSTHRTSRRLAPSPGKYAF